MSITSWCLGDLHFSFSKSNLNSEQAIAQIVAKCHGIYANDHFNSSSSPIYGILCDGTSFEFFSFDGGTSPPTFSRGVYRTLEGLSLADYHSTTGIDYIRSLRPICEVLFYFLLLVYGAGVRAYMLRSKGDGTRAKHPRKSTPGWTEADKLATSALSHAMNAAIVATALDSAADEETEDTLKCLQQRSASYFRSQNLMIF